MPGEGGGESVKTEVHDFRGDQTYPETRGHDFELTHGFDEVEAAGCSWVDGVATAATAD